MTYDSLDELPKRIKELPKKAQEIFIEAFNSAWERYKDLGPKEREERSFAVAWSAIRKAGFSAFKAFTIPQNQTKKVKINADGSAIFYGATLFAAGTWTDSVYRKPIKFEEQELAKRIKLWEGTPIWDKHPAPGQRHAAREHIGTNENTRMEQGEVKADLYTHGKTQASRDAISMWEAGNLKDLSAELTTVDIMKDQVIYGTKVTPYGVAWVIKGACTVCKAHGCTKHSTHYEAAVGAHEGAAAKFNGGENMSEIEELKTKLEASEVKIKELSDCRDDKVTRLEAAETANMERFKEFETSVSKKDKTIESLEKQLAEGKSALTEAETKIKVYENLPMLKTKTFSAAEGKKEPSSRFSRERDGTMDLKVI